MCPFLFMGNSPAPESYDPVIDYSDFEVTNREYVEAENDTYRLAVDVTNTGDKYMLVENAFGAFTLNDEILFRLDGIVSDLYLDELIAPHQTVHLISWDKMQNNSFPLEMYTFSAKAIDNERFKTPKYSEIKLYDKNVLSEATSYDFRLKGLVYSHEYYYETIFDINVEDMNISFRSYYFADYISIYLKDSDYVEEDFVFNAIYIIPIRNRTIYDINDIWSGVWTGIVVASIAGFFISPAFIPLIIKSAKKKRREEQEKTLS